MPVGKSVSLPVLASQTGSVVTDPETPYDKDSQAFVTWKHTIGSHNPRWCAAQTDVFRIYDLCKTVEVLGEDSISKMAADRKARSNKLRATNSKLAGKLIAVDKNRAARAAKALAKRQNPIDAARQPSLMDEGIQSCDAAPVMFEEDASPKSEDADIFAHTRTEWENTPAKRKNAEKSTTMPPIHGRKTTVNEMQTATDPVKPRHGHRDEDHNEGKDQKESKAHDGFKEASSLDDVQCAQAAVRKKKTVKLNSEEEKQRRQKRNMTTSLLKECHLLKELAMLDSSVMSKVASVAIDVHLKEGTVMFRQGDPPRAYYMVLKGKVSILVRPWDIVNAEARERDVHGNHGRTIRTFENCSYYKKDEDFGFCVNSLGAGSVFGERALLSDAVRGATIVCLEPCDLLCVKKSDFDKSVQRDVLIESRDRMLFFKQNVTGFEDIPKDIEVHPSYWFEPQKFKSGDLILEEGAVVEPTIWVVKTGEVMLKRQGWDRTDDSEKKGPGGFFGSMAVIPFPAAEPFDVEVISEECDVFVLSSSHLKDFTHIPECIYNRLRGILRDDTMKRLKKLCLHHNFGRDPMDSPRSVGFKDWKDAPSAVPRNTIGKKIEASQSLPSLTTASPTSPSGSSRVKSGKAIRK